jgi:hypothetical protein
MIEMVENNKNGSEIIERPKRDDYDTSNVKKIASSAKFMKKGFSKPPAKVIAPTTKDFHKKEF